MTEDRNSYKNILKSISLFGGVKIFQILIGIIKNKVIAILLGPNGMGIAGLISSSTEMVAALTGCGLHTSAVRDVAQAHDSKDEKRIGATITVLRKLVWLTGLLGMAVVFLMAPMLSVWAFGGKDYTIAFRVVSVIMLFNQINIGQTVLLQGTFHYKYMAKSALFGNVLGLVITLPLYYLFGIKAIVPAIIISSLIALSLSWYYSSKISFCKVKFSIKEWWIKGRGMISLGIVIALTGLAGVGQAYGLRIFISNIGGVADVGLYVAGFAISSTYVNLILSSMSSDYAPRLSVVANNNILLTSTINKQANLLLVILTPLVLIFIVFVKLLIILLYSTQFVEIVSMTEWVMLGMFFRTISWTISFSFIARGESRIFFLNELLATIYMLVFYVLGYKVYGFEGMGIAFFVSYICYSLQMFIIAKLKFQFYFEREFLKNMIVQILFCVLLFTLLKIIGYSSYRYILGVFFIVVSVYFCYKKLNKMIDLKSMIHQFKNKMSRK